MRTLTKKIWAIVILQWTFGVFYILRHDYSIKINYKHGKKDDEVQNTGNVINKKEIEHQRIITRAD